MSRNSSDLDKAASPNFWDTQDLKPEKIECQKCTAPVQVLSTHGTIEHWRLACHGVLVVFDGFVSRSAGFRSVRIFTTSNRPSSFAACSQRCLVRACFANPSP